MSDVIDPVQGRTRGKQSRRLWVASAVILIMTVVGGVWWWSAPRERVPVPGPEATAEQTFTAYVESLKARDFDTANEIDARADHHDIGRLGRPLTFVNVADVETRVHGDAAYVTFTADFKNNDGSLDDGQMWGLSLTRGTNGRWHITGEGVG